MPYLKVMNRRCITLYGIIIETLSAYYSWARCSINNVHLLLLDLMLNDHKLRFLWYSFLYFYRLHSHQTTPQAWVSLITPHKALGLSSLRSKPKFTPLIHQKPRKKNQKHHHSSKKFRLRRAFIVYLIKYKHNISRF